jgi:hypothetical protein
VPVGVRTRVTTVQFLKLDVLQHIAEKVSQRTAEGRASAPPFRDPSNVFLQPVGGKAAAGAIPMQMYRYRQNACLAQRHLVGAAAVWISAATESGDPDFCA